MTRKKSILTLDELRRRYENYVPWVGRKIYHVKSQSWYRITGFHLKEADLTVEFTYQTMHRVPVTFSRPVTELVDGRFRMD